jgi:transcriptional regulator with XRE-family HTH domain
VRPLYILLGRQLAHFRLKAGVTQAELAEKTSYTTGFISLVERGVHAPTLARLEKMAGIIGVEVWRLFYPIPETKLLKGPLRRKRPVKPKRSKR